MGEGRLRDGGRRRGATMWALVVVLTQAGASASAPAGDEFAVIPRRTLMWAGAVQRLGASGVGHIPALARADAMFAMRALRSSPSVASANAASPPAPSGSLFGAIVLERYPVIMAELPKWERDFMEWSWEMQNAKRKDYPEKLIATKYNETNSEDVDWQPAPRVTPDDVKGNVKSLWRALDQKLYLIVKHQSGDWMFPHLPHQDGQTMRQTAEAAMAGVALTEDCYVIGNPPSAHFVVPEGTTVGDAKPGDTVFFHRANYLQKKYRFLKPPGLVEYAWVTNTDLWTNYFKGEHAELMKLFLASPPAMQDRSGEPDLVREIAGEAKKAGDEESKPAAKPKKAKAKAKTISKSE